MLNKFSETYQSHEGDGREMSVENCGSSYSDAKGSELYNCNKTEFSLFFSDTL